jgi:23S rRNA (cytidine2498-2'-O)-methyltransferase
VSQFIFTICQVGAENALKAELARHHPALRFAYSRPGFVTFKNNGPEFAPDFRLHSVFAREYGICDGKLAGPSGLKPDPAARVHAFDVDEYFPGDEPEGYRFDQRSREFRRNTESPPEPGDRIVDLICVRDGDWWTGHHIHHEGHTGWPGGRPDIPLPADAPSRAYLKFEEARRLSGFEFRAGETALEIGATPGGAAFRILELGLNYVGIDPKPMAPVLAVKFPDRFRQIIKDVHLVKPADLPSPVHWILLDANLPPHEMLPEIRRLVRHYTRPPHPTLRGVVLTLKLNDWKFADEIPGFLEQIHSMVQPRSFSKFLARQLATNRQEFVVTGELK